MKDGLISKYSFVVLLNTISFITIYYFFRYIYWHFLLQCNMLVSISH